MLKQSWYFCMIKSNKCYDIFGPLYVNFRIKFLAGTISTLILTLIPHDSLT